MWRRVAPYAEHARWCGALVVSPSARGEGAGGAYAVRADLAPADARAVEPAMRLARGAGGRHFHAYPDEGLADPREAAAAVRAAAAAAGARFAWGVSCLLYTSPSPRD